MFFPSSYLCLDVLHLSSPQLSCQGASVSGKNVLNKDGHGETEQRPNPISGEGK